MLKCIGYEHIIHYEGYNPLRRTRQTRMRRISWWMTSCFYPSWKHMLAIWYSKCLMFFSPQPVIEELVINTHPHCARHDQTPRASPPRMSSTICRGEFPRHYPVKQSGYCCRQLSRWNVTDKPYYSSAMHEKFPWSTVLKKITHTVSYISTTPHTACPQDTISIILYPNIFPLNYLGFGATLYETHNLRLATSRFVGRVAQSV
jgi:hypothetical protein